jgi:hypothetical protein
MLAEGHGTCGCSFWIGGGRNDLEVSLCKAGGFEASTAAGAAAEGAGTTATERVGIIVFWNAGCAELA